MVLNENENYDVFRQLEDLVADQPLPVSKEAPETAATYLDITDKDGSRYGFPIYIKRAITYLPGEDKIQLDFGATKVQLRGRNLALLYEHLLQDSLSSLTVTDVIYDEGLPDTWSIHEVSVTEST